MYREWADVAVDPAVAAGALTLEGVLGLRGVLAADEASALSTFVDKELAKRKLQATAADASPEEPAAIAAFDRWFGEVRERRARYDLKLDIGGPAVRQALHALCMAVSPIIEELLTLDAVVVELASLISDPGARQQDYHPDSVLPSTCGTPLYTVFVALQDIDRSMGPTRVLPKTHDEESHRRLRSKAASGAKDRNAADESGVHMACMAGDAFVMDSRLWHRGGCNASVSRRRLLYVTFAAPHCFPPGSTYSILDEFVGRLRLRNYDCWLREKPAECPK